MQSFTFIVLIATLAVASAGYLNAVAPAVSYGHSTYSYGAPAYRTAYAAAPLTTYGGHYGYAGHGYAGAYPAVRAAYGGYGYGHGYAHGYGHGSYLY